MTFWNSFIIHNSSFDFDMSSPSIASADLAALAQKQGTKDEGPRTNDNVRAADPWALSTARVLLIATLIGAPWAYGAMVPWAWVALGLIASLALFLWALGTVQRGELTLVWSPLYVPIAMFFLLGLVQYAARLTLDRSETRQALVLLAADLVFFFLAVQLFADAGRKAERAFGLLVLVFAAAIGLFAILQFASGERQIYGRFNLPTAFFGPYDNADHFAGLMEMLIPVAVFYIVGARASHSLRSEPALSGAKGQARASVAAVEACPVGDRRYRRAGLPLRDRKSTRLNSSHLGISYALFCLKKEKSPDAPRQAVGRHRPTRRPASTALRSRRRRQRRAEPKHH